MPWLNVLWVVVVTLAVLAVCGYSLARVIGLRGYWAIAVAPAFAATIISGTAIVAAWLRIPWSILPVLVMTVVVGSVLGAVRWLTRRFRGPQPATQTRRVDRWLVAGLLVGAVLLTARVVAIIGGPEHISQTFDNIFHLNATRFILETGSASSFTVGLMTNPGGNLGFYPAGWHALVSLGVQLTGVSIPAAVNGITIVVAAVIWPLGIMLLTRTLFGRSPALSVAAGLFAASVPVFPILLMDYGVLYPYQLGVALVPVALAASVRLLGFGVEQRAGDRWWWAVVLLGVIPGMAIAHPGAFMAWVALSVPLATVFFIVRWRAGDGARVRVMLIVCSVVYLVIGFVLLWRLRPPAEARGWPLQMGLHEAILDVLTVSAWYHASAALVAASVIAGIVWVCITRTAKGWIALGFYVVTAALFIVVAALPLATIRDALTGPWYNNLPRLAALLAIAVVPLAAYGAAKTWERIAATRLVRGAGTVLKGALAAIVFVLAVALTQIGPFSPLPVAERWASAAFALTSSSPLVAADEAALLDRLDEYVPEGVAVAGSPWTGASLAYALSDRPVLMPHTLMDVSREVEAINDGLAWAQPGDDVCAAVDELNVGFVLMFSDIEVHSGHHSMPGLEALSKSDVVELVDQEGDARLYEIVGCRTP